MIQILQPQTLLNYHIKHQNHKQLKFFVNKFMAMVLDLMYIFLFQYMAVDTCQAFTFLNTLKNTKMEACP